MSRNNDDQKKIPIFIITTSSRKSDHLKFLASEMGLIEKHGLRFYQIPWEYHEMQSDSMEFLLSESIERNIFNRIRNTFFIIEQTSVFLESDIVEGPGQYFKRWWKGQTEEDLIDLSRNPGAEVESGLALNVPGGNPIIATNRVKGKVDVDGEVLDENKKYSWLAGEDFSAYFSPEKSKKVYTQMEINEFLKHDFRKPNFDVIGERLIEYSSILRANVSIESLNDKVNKFVKPEELRRANEGFVGIGEESGQHSISDFG